MQEVVATAHGALRQPYLFAAANRWRGLQNRHLQWLREKTAFSGRMCDEA